MVAWQLGQPVQLLMETPVEHPDIHRLPLAVAVAVLGDLRRHLLELAVVEAEALGALLQLL